MADVYVWLVKVYRGRYALQQIVDCAVLGLAFVDLTKITTEIETDRAFLLFSGPLPPLLTER
jgi:hypothetical protein